MKLSVMTLIIICLAFNSASTYSFNIDTQADSIKKLLNGLNPKQKVDAYNELASKLLTDQTLKSDYYALTALGLARNINYSAGQANALIILGRIDDLLSRPSEADRHLNQALAVARNSGNNLVIARSYFNLANLHMNQRMFSVAVIEYNKALQIGRQIDDKSVVYYCLSGLGELYNTINDYSRSIDYLQKALELQKQSGSKNSISLCYSRLGTVYSDQDSLAKALIYFNKAYDHSLQFGSKSAQANAANDLGNTFNKLKLYDKSLYYHNQCLNLSKEINWQLGIAASYTNLGSLFSDMKNFTTARLYLDSAMRLSILLKDNEGVAFINRNLGDYYHNQRLFKKAADCYNLALDFFQKKGYRHEVQKVSFSLYENCNQSGDFKNAMKFYKLYSDTRESLDADVSQNLFDVVKAKVEAEREVEILKNRNNSQAAKNDNLRNIVLISIVLLVIAYFVVYSRIRLTRALKIKENEIVRISGIQEQAYSTLVTDIKNSLFPLGYNITLTQDSVVHDELINSYDNFLIKLNGLIRHLANRRESEGNA